MAKRGMCHVHIQVFQGQKWSEYIEECSSIINLSSISSITELVKRACKSIGSQLASGHLGTLNPEVIYQSIHNGSNEVGCTQKQKQKRQYKLGCTEWPDMKMNRQVWWRGVSLVLLFRPPSHWFSRDCCNIFNTHSSNKFKTRNVFSSFTGRQLSSTGRQFS